MAHIHKISLLSKRLSVVLNHVHLSGLYGNRAWQKHEIMSFSTIGSFKFNSFNSSTSENITEPIKKFCTLTKTDFVEEQEVTIKKNPTTLESLAEINLSDSDVMGTFRKLLQIFTVNRFYRYPFVKKNFREFVNSKEFREYCNSLEQKLPMLSAQDLKILLKCHHFEIQASSVLLQKIYHLVIEKINDYSPIDIVSIYETIKYPAHRYNPKSRVLQLICEEYFQSKMFNNIYECRDYNELAFYCKAENLPSPVKRKLMSVLARNFHIVQNELNLYGLCRMFSAFSDPALLSYFRPEMYDAVKAKITENPSVIQIYNVLLGLQRLMGNGVNYDEPFLNALAEQLLQKRPNVIISLEIIKAFLRLDYLPLSLIMRLEEGVANPNFTIRSSKFSFLIAQALSFAYYHPQGYTGDDSNHIECIKKLELLSFDEANMDDRVRMCLYLTVLGSEKKIERLNELFQHFKNSSEETINRVHLSPATAETIISLNAFARKHFPKNVMELPERVLQKCYSSLMTGDIKYLHETTLKFLNADAALEYCSTSMYHLIDFALLLDEHNEPQKIATDSKSEDLKSGFKIEDIERPPSWKLILYQFYKGELPYEFKNSSKQSGTMQLYLESLKASLKDDCKLVFLPLRKLLSLNQARVVSYLENKVNESLQGK